MRQLVFALLLPLLLLFTSCGKDYDYEIVVDEQFVLNLETSGMGSGYSWQWEKKDDILDTIGWEFIPYEFPTGPGVERWTFVGRRKGITTIKMIYKQPWETEIVDSREYEVRVK